MRLSYMTLCSMLPQSMQTKLLSNPTTTRLLLCIRNACCFLLTFLSIATFLLFKMSIIDGLDNRILYSLLAIVAIVVIIILICTICACWRRCCIACCSRCFKKQNNHRRLDQEDCEAHQSLISTELSSEEDAEDPPTQPEQVHPSVGPGLSNRQSDITWETDETLQPTQQSQTFSRLTPNHAQPHGPSASHNQHSIPAGWYEGQSDTKLWQTDETSLSTQQSLTPSTLKPSQAEQRSLSAPSNHNFIRVEQSEPTDLSLIVVHSSKIHDRATQQPPQTTRTAVRHPIGHDASNVTPTAGGIYVPPQSQKRAQSPQQDGKMALERKPITHQDEQTNKMMSEERKMVSQDQDVPQSPLHDSRMATERGPLAHKNEQSGQSNNKDKYNDKDKHSDRDRSSDKDKYTTWETDETLQPTQQSQTFSRLTPNHAQPHGPSASHNQHSIPAGHHEGQSDTKLWQTDETCLSSQQSQSPSTLKPNQAQHHGLPAPSNQHLIQVEQSEPTDLSPIVVCSSQIHDRATQQPPQTTCTAGRHHIGHDASNVTPTAGGIYVPPERQKTAQSPQHDGKMALERKPITLQDEQTNKMMSGEGKMVSQYENVPLSPLHDSRMATEGGPLAHKDEKSGQSNDTDKYSDRDRSSDKDKYSDRDRSSDKDKYRDTDRSSDQDKYSDRDRSQMVTRAEEAKTSQAIGDNKMETKAEAAKTSQATVDNKMETRATKAITTDTTEEDKMERRATEANTTEAMRVNHIKTTDETREDLEKKTSETKEVKMETIEGTREEEPKSSDKTQGKREKMGIGTMEEAKTTEATREDKNEIREEIREEEAQTTETTREVQMETTEATLKHEEQAAQVTWKDEAKTTEERVTEKAETAEGPNEGKETAEETTQEDKERVPAEEADLLNINLETVRQTEETVKGGDEDLTLANSTRETHTFYDISNTKAGDDIRGQAEDTTDPYKTNRKDQYHDEQDHMKEGTMRSHYHQHEQGKNWDDKTPDADTETRTIRRDRKDASEDWTLSEEKMHDDREPVGSRNQDSNQGTKLNKNDPGRNADNRRYRTEEKEIRDSLKENTKTGINGEYEEAGNRDSQMKDSDGRTDGKTDSRKEDRDDGRDRSKNEDNRWSKSYLEESRTKEQQDKRHISGSESSGRKKYKTEHEHEDQYDENSDRDRYRNRDQDRDRDATRDRNQNRDRDQNRDQDRHSNIDQIRDEDLYSERNQTRHTGRDQNRDRDQYRNIDQYRDRDRSRDQDEYRDRDRSRDKNKYRDRDRSRDKDKYRDRDRSSDKDKYRDRDRSRDKDKYRDRDRSSDKDKYRDRDRSSDKDKYRDKDQYNEPRKESYMVVPKESHTDERIQKVLGYLEPLIQEQVCEDMWLKVVPAAQCMDVLNGTLILPCIAASRVGSDVEAAVNNSKLPASVRFVLLLFHHQAPHNRPVYPTRKKGLSVQALQARCKDIIDFVYWMDDGIYDSVTNRRALEELADALK